MSHHRYSEESRPTVSITPAITKGGSWTARLIPDNNLRQHCHLLARTFRGPHPLTDPIRDPCARLLEAVEGKCGLLTAIHPSRFPAIPVLVRIAAYHGNWIREPETWAGQTSKDPREIVYDLLRHLFAAWGIPEFFDNAWLVKGDLTYLERDWYCHFASGGSLRNVQGMPRSITSRALHLAMNAPRDLTIRQALRWGQIHALGGSPALLTEVLSSHMVRDLSNDAVWSRLFEKLVAAGNFNPKHFGLIADTLLEVIRKDGCHRAQSLVALPLKDLLSHCRRYWQAILRSVRIGRPEWLGKDVHCPHLRYDLRHINAGQWARLPRSRPFESMCVEGKETLRCRIEELTHQWQLVAESQVMKHCVDTYGRSCKLGRCSIFSVRTEDMVKGKLVSTSHLTIEVDRRTRRIVQVRGRRNQHVFAQRIPLLRKWAGQMELTF